MRIPTITLAILLFWLPAALAEPVLEAFANDSLEPAFSLPDLKDGIHELQDYRGKVVLVNFWATWCPSCIHEMPDLKHLADTFAGEAFEIVAVNVGEAKYRVWKFVEMVSFDLPVLLDSDKALFNSWGLTVLPTSFLFDKNGQVRYKVQAVPHWDSDETLSVIRKLLQEQETTQ